MRIVTLTLSPCLDVYCYAEGVELGRENKARTLCEDLGGKGINVSRALLENGIESTCIVAVPQEDGEKLCSLAAAVGVELCAISVRGRVRRNITLHTADGVQTRICFDEGILADGLVGEISRRIEEIFGASHGEECILVLAGSIPSGVCASELCELLRALRARGVRLVLDSRSLSREQVLSLSPWLIKPNREEIGAYTDVAVTDVASAALGARELHLAGIENVLVTLDGDGAALCCPEGEFLLSAPRIDVRSAIGAGDSTVAGFIAAACLGERGADALRRAVCYGSAACMREGTAPPSPADVRMLLDKMK